MSIYKCDKCQEEVHDKSGWWWVHYEFEGKKIRVNTHLCYCYNCHRYESAQIGIKQKNLLSIKEDLNSKYSFWDKIFHRKNYKDIRRSLTLCNLLLRVNYCIGDTTTSCIACGSPSIALIQDLNNRTHGESCCGKLHHHQSESSDSIRFRIGTNCILPTNKWSYQDYYRTPKTVKKCEKKLLEFYYLE